MPIDLSLIHPNTDSDTVPSPRDIWNGMVPHKGALHMFGGATTKFGPAQKTADLGTLGTLNDLWKYTPGNEWWELVQEDDDRRGFTDTDGRPCGRVLPARLSVDTALYLFGGISILDIGWNAVLLNDLWRLDPDRMDWALLEEHDGIPRKDPADALGPRPRILSGTGAATIGEDIYSHK